MQVSDRELTPERYNFSFCNTILVSRVKEGKAREAAALLRDILARDLDRTAEANVASLKGKTSHRNIFERNDMVLRVTMEANLVEEAKEIALLLVKRDMKFQTFFMSQICQASHCYELKYRYNSEHRRLRELARLQDAGLHILSKEFWISESRK